MFAKLNLILSQQDRIYIYFLLFISLIVSLIELIGISAIAPFISIASDLSLIENKPYYAYFYHLFKFDSTYHFVIFFGIALLLFYCFRSIANLIYQHLLARFTFGRYHIIVGRLFVNYLGMNYQDFLTKNTSYLTKTITTEAHNFTILLAAILFMTSEVFVVLLIYGTLLFVNFKITLGLTIMLGFFGLLMSKFVSQKIKKQGKQKEFYQKSFFESLASSFGNYKIIKLQSNNQTILDNFTQSSWGYSLANIKNQTFFHIPRLLLEAIGFCMMIAVVLYLFITDGKNMSAYLPLLSMYVLALYRLLPSINRILDSYNKILFNYRSLEIIYQDIQMQTKKLGDEKIEFCEKIELKNICFGYTQDKKVLENVNLTLKKGSKTAFIGESGSGKSTLVDLIISLLEPNSGEIYIDQTKLCDKNLKSWRSKIGYIPQNVYLFDGNVADNVAFGREFNEEKMINCLKLANIYDFLTTKEGIHTQVGDSGIALSGGQKQRIAIARALYGDPEILVLDEATSALDNQTEQKIMEEIYQISQNKTLLIIAHRLSTIQKCDSIYQIKKGIPKKISYDDL